MIFSDVIEIETAVVLIITLGRICALCFNTRTLHCKETENLVFDILLPKSKPITIGAFSRPPSQAEFMDLTVKKLSNLNLKDNEIYLLSDFNIILFQNGKYILNKKEAPPLNDQSIL